MEDIFATETRAQRLQNPQIANYFESLITFTVRSIYDKIEQHGVDAVADGLQGALDLRSRQITGSLFSRPPRRR